MKARLAMLLAAVLLVLLGASALAEVTYYGTMMVDNCEEWVSLRDGPGTGCGRLAKVPLFALVTDAEWEPICGDFIYCNYDGQFGYILAKYLVPWADPEPEEAGRFVSDLGFSFDYDAGFLTVDTDMSEDGQGLILYPSEGDLPVYLEIMTAESIGAPTWKFLEVNAEPGTEYVEDLTDEGADMHWFQKNADYGGGILQTYYAVDGPKNALAAVATYPSAADRDWNIEFLGVMRSIRFEDPAIAWAEWTEGGAEDLVVDTDGAWVALRVDAAVKGVRFLALTLTDFDEDGNVDYDAEVLYEQSALTPDAPLKVKVAFPGDIPAYGLRFTDAAGETHRYALGLSGMDGSLTLTEW